MSRPALPAERGADLQRDTPTLSELKAAHDWRQEERAEGRYIVDVCQQCGHESGGGIGAEPDCAVHEVPPRLTETAKRHGLLPETTGGRDESMLGVPSSTGRAD
jgi:hypothetical protein